MLPENYFEHTTEQVLANITKMTTGPDPTENLMNAICHVYENLLVVDYRYFKYIASKNSYETIFTHITNVMNKHLFNHSQLQVHLCIKGLTVAELDKHTPFFKNITQLLNTRYENKMATCHVYKSSFIFSQLFALVSCFIDKETLQKVQLVKPC